MKVGITTFQWGSNYGAVLQAHALQSSLRDRGHDVQIVDYRVGPSCSWARKWLAKTPGNCLRKWEAAYRDHLFEVFRKNHLTRTPKVLRSKEDLKQMTNRFDVLIAGSDQIWNPRWLSQADVLCDLYFLTFAGKKTRRISYAASFGQSETATIEPAWQASLGEKLKTFDAISVREASGIDMVRDLCGREDAVQVADPTFLLIREHYESMVGTGRDREQSLFSYMLHGEETNADDMCRQIAESRQLHVTRCNVKRTGLRRGYVLPSPTDWLRRIRDASFVVTNSFHATVFCLIFHTPFIVLPVSGQLESMNARLVELLGTVGLGRRIAVPGDGVSDRNPNEEIDWKRVDQNISAMRTKSVKFLIEQGL